MKDYKKKILDNADEQIMLFKEQSKQSHSALFNPAYLWPAENAKVLVHELLNDTTSYDAFLRQVKRCGMAYNVGIVLPKKVWSDLMRLY